MKKFALILAIVTILLGVYYVVSKQSEQKDIVTNTEQQDGAKEKTAPAQKKKDKPIAAKEEKLIDDGTHLTFKSVPINGTLKQYTKAMKDAGFKVERQYEDRAVLTGDFAGYKDCSISVYTLQNRDLVSRIAVSFPERENWKELYGNYTALKSMLTKKYGQPSSCIEKFEGYIYSHMDDRDRMNKVERGNCNYKTTFKADKGTMILQIYHDETNFSSSYVLLTYQDKVNSNIVQQDAMNDL